MSAPAALATDLVDTWIYATLLADPTLFTLGCTGIHNTIAPLDAVFPLVTFANTSGRDTTTQKGLRTLSRQTYVITVAGAGSSRLVLATIAARLDLLLQLTESVPWGGGWIHTCIRDGVTTLSPTRDGVVYREIKATYEIQVQGG